MADVAPVHMSTESAGGGSAGLAGWGRDTNRRDFFYPRLEALRGVAALTVAAFHSWHSPWLDPAGQTRDFLSISDGQGFAGNVTSLVLRVIGNGLGAVVLFFVISGFVLSGSLARGPHSIPRVAMRFLLARLFRIYPAVFATIAIFATLFWSAGVFIDTTDGYAPLALLRNALLIDVSIDGVMWTLQLEMIAIPLIFVTYLGSRRWGLAVPAAMFLGLAVLSFWGPWDRAIGAPNMFGTIHAFMPGMVAYFVAPGLLKQCSPRVAKFAFAGAAAGFLASRPVLGIGSHWAVLCEAIFGAVVVAILASDCPGALGRIFDLSIIRFFGRISYSFYLLHPLTFLVMGKIPGPLASAMEAGVPVVVMATFLFVASTAAVTPLAFAMYRWVERPAVAAGGKLAKSMLRRREHAGTISAAKDH
jgi:peptidoglycan/LPS O-acetylase OafA/YrhL